MPHSIQNDRILAALSPVATAEEPPRERDTEESGGSTATATRPAPSPPRPRRLPP